MHFGGSTEGAKFRSAMAELGRFTAVGIAIAEFMRYPKEMTVPEQVLIDGLSLGAMA